jgi:RNA polymerase sigma-70 factor (ECF subfamily)
LADTFLLGLTSEPAADWSSAYEDEQLAHALREGDNQAYEVLVSRFQQPVYNLVYRLMTDPGDASDVVQEVFLKVFRNIGRFRNQSSLKTWIYRIAVNEAHNHRRWFFRHRRKEVELEGPAGTGGTVEETLSDAGRSPFEFVSDLETHALVEKALSRINPSFRAAVVLRDIEGLSYEEVADILGISMGTVKSRILRGREALREELTGRLEPQPAFDWTPQTVD